MQGSQEADTESIPCWESSNVVLLVKLQVIPFSQIGRLVRVERAFMRSTCPPVLCQMNLIIPQAEFLVIDSQESNEFPPAQVHFAKFIPAEILLTTILLLHG